jgi:hypothetical protein
VLLGAGGTQKAVLQGKFTIAEATEFEFQNSCNGDVGGASQVDSILGIDNIYSPIQLYRVTHGASVAALSEWLLVLLCAVMLVTAYWLTRRQPAEV